MALIRNATRLNKANLAVHQQSAWQRQIQYVQSNSLFYQRLWGGRQAPLQLQELPELALSDKAQLRESQQLHPPFGDYLASSTDQVTRLHRTSGTTGQAMNLALSSQDSHITQVVGGRCQSAAGLNASHTVVHCLNYRMWMGGVTDHMTLEQTGATVVPFGIGDSELLIHTIREIGATAISCTPSYPAVLEKVLRNKFRDLQPADLGLKLGLFGGEPGLDDPAFRQRIENRWGMTARNANYGVSDVFCNFAAQCEYDTCLHFMAADVLYAELIDPDTTQALPMDAGQQGELVLTHLARECQPVVRFRTGDIINIKSTEPCQCGCTGMRFRVIGRSDDMIVVRGVNLFPTMVAAVVNEFEALSGNYRIVLEQPPPYDLLPLQVELAEGKQAGVGLAETVERRIKQKLGATAQVTLLPAGNLPLVELKTSRVVRSYK